MSRLNRAGAVAIRNATIHAARGLVAGVFLAQGNGEFAIMLRAIGDRLILRSCPVDFQKTCDLAH